MSTPLPTSEADARLFDTGDELPHLTDCLWLILDGVVKSYTLNESGSFITLGFWGSEDLVGHSSSIAPYNLQCLSTVKAIAVHRDGWNNFSKNLLNYALQTQQLSYIVRNNRIARRLWLLLEWLANKFGRTVEQGRSIDFKLTHQELADAIGTTRITVTKTLIQFEREGSILRPKTRSIILTGN